MNAKMKDQSLKKFTFYRLRYWLGYIIISLAFIGIIALAVLEVPGGLNAAEETSALKSASLNLREPLSLLVTDLPYHALQKISFFLFGLSSISIKLPSALIAFLTGVGFVLLMRRWFAPGISVIVSGIAIASAAFIYLAQQGTPAIMSLFWPVAIMLLASWSVSKHRFAPLALVMLGITAALSLYTPLAIYTLLALVIGGLLHPHVRYVVRRKIPTLLLTLATVLGILCLLPLLYMLYRTPELLASIFLSSSGFDVNPAQNIKLLALQFGDMTGASSAITSLSTPFFILPTSLIIIFGAVRLFYARHTAQNYILSSWLILLIPVTLLNPLHPEILFIPLMLLAGVGVVHMLRYWYRLFPANPYARAFGLMLMVVLLGGLMTTGMLRYYNTHHYSPSTVAKISFDLPMLHDKLRQVDALEATALVVSDREMPFYQLYVDTHELPVNVTTSYRSAQEKGSELIIATKDSDIVSKNRTPTYVMASRSATTASDRFYVYKNGQ